MSTFIPDHFVITELYDGPAAFDPRAVYVISDEARTTAHRAWCMSWLPALITAAQPVLAQLAADADRAALLAGDSVARASCAEADLPVAVHAVAWDGVEELPEYAALHRAHETVREAAFVLENAMDDCAAWAYGQMRALLDPLNDGDVTQGSGPRAGVDGE